VDTHNLDSSPSLQNNERPIRHWKSISHIAKIEKEASSSSSDSPSDNNSLSQLKDERNMLPIGLSRPVPTL